jgi:predicted lipid-binding transport protein (Tim44 family)
MKKLLTLLSTAALACTLAMPVFAKPGSPRAAKGQAKTATTATTKKSKAHRKHASKRGAQKGAKMVPQGTNPAPGK